MHKNLKEKKESNTSYTVKKHTVILSKLTPFFSKEKSPENKPTNTECQELQRKILEQQSCCRYFQDLPLWSQFLSLSPSVSLCRVSLSLSLWQALPDSQQIAFSTVTRAISWKEK
jgi:hypothetical protein